MNPATVTSPDVGCRSPASIFSVVVFPAPFGPRKPTRSPAAISKERSSTATTRSLSLRTSERIAAQTPGERRWTK